MPRKKFHCRLCKRSFSMAAYLGRHMNTMHGGGQRARKVVARFNGPGGKRRSSQAVSSDGCAHLVATLEAYCQELKAQSLAIEAQMRAATQAIEALSGFRRVNSASQKGPALHAERPSSLKQYIVRVLSEAGQPLGPRDIGLNVRRAGYRTKAKDLTKAVGNALPELKNIKKVGYGQYGLRG